MPIPKSDHPLTQQKPLAAIGILGVWGVGVTLDPRSMVAVFICVTAIAATVWLYLEDFRAIRSGQIDGRLWWFPLSVVGAEILIPCYLFYAKADETKPQSTVTSAQQQGGQAGVINNNGPVYNTAPKDDSSPNKGPVMFDFKAENGGAIRNIQIGKTVSCGYQKVLSVQESAGGAIDGITLGEVETDCKNKNSKSP